MKPFNPLKPLIAAMFALAAATASAQTVTVTDPASVEFKQVFTVSESQSVQNFTFFGTQSFDTLSFLSFEGGSIDGDLFYEGTYGDLSSEGTYIGSGWTFSGFNFGAGTYTALMALTPLQEVTTSADSITVAFSTNGTEGVLTSYDSNSEPTVTNGGFTVSTALVTAVPEPESYAMLLAGLGLMGAIARRRSRKA